MGWRAHLRYCDHRRAQRRRSRRRAVDHLSYLHPARRPAPAPPTCGTRHSSAPSTLKVPIGFVCSARPRLHTNRLHVRRRGRTQRCEGTQRSLTNFRHFCTDPTHPGLRHVYCTLWSLTAHRGYRSPLTFIRELSLSLSHTHTQHVDETCARVRPWVNDVVQATARHA